jgi:XTP/dITP diphosphohydrolase
MRYIDKLLIATHNAGKLREIQDLLGADVSEIVSAGQLGLPEAEETGTTFEENALIKARAAAKASGCVAVADDSGLCVKALGGKPGLHSARWAGPEKDFSKAVKRIREELEDVVAQVRGWVNRDDPSPAKTKDLPSGKSKFLIPLPQGERDSFLRQLDTSAYFACVLAIVWPDGHQEVFEGRCDGHLVWAPRGKNGHGYDPWFVPEGCDRTFAEMDDAEKNALSHRGKAIRKLAEKLFEK